MARSLSVLEILISFSFPLLFVAVGLNLHSSSFPFLHTTRWTSSYFLDLIPLFIFPNNILIEKLAFAEPSTIKAIMPLDTWEADRRFHMSLLATEDGTDHDRAHNVHMEEIRTTPLFSGDVLAGVIKSPAPAVRGGILPQYGLLAQRLCTYGDSGPDTHSDALIEQQPNAEPEDTRLFINVNTPWSAFICGSQGSGKSHTLSCMLESALIPSRLGKLPRPLAGIVFHYDKFSGFASSQICEAAYLCSSGIRVRVIVSLSNYSRMKKLYKNLPGIDKKLQPEVVPLLLKESQLNVERMMKLMAVNEKEGSKPLYMEVGY